MAYRKKMKRKASRKHFSKNADRIKRVNVDPRPMRGGIRL